MPSLVASLKTLTAPPKSTSPLTYKNPTQKQLDGQAVARDLALLLVTGGGLQSEPWYRSAILALFRASETVPAVKARIPPSFVATEVTPALTLDFCAVYRTWRASGLNVDHAPTSILNVAEKGATSLDAVLGTNAVATIKSWGATAALTQTWTAEARAGVSRIETLSRSTDPLWPKWLKSTGLEAQFKRLGTRVTF